MGVTFTVTKQRRDEEREGSDGCYPLSAIFSLIVIGLAYWIYPEALPYTFWEPWTHLEGDVFVWVYTVGFLFIWGAVLTVIVNLINFQDRDYSDYIGLKFVIGCVRSIIAGVLEEISFRWLIFYSSIVTVQLTNYFLFGFAGYGLIEILHNNIFGPLANFVTLGYLSQYLVNPAVWMIGAGMLAANAFFRDGHKYQGTVGIINSWFAGMLLFWVMFRFGLVAAIVVHFLYDFMIDLIGLAFRLVHKQVNG